MTDETKLDKDDAEIIKILSELRSRYNFFDEAEEPYYRALSEAIKSLSERTDGDTISRQAAIDALWKALHEYEDKTEKQFQESEDLDVGEWIEHRIFVQNMNDIDRQTILNLPSAQPEKTLLTVKVEIDKEELQRTISKISAQPEIIHCKDCASCSRDALYDDYWCDGREVTADHYCGYAERREDGN